MYSLRTKFKVQSSTVW